MEHGHYMDTNGDLIPFAVHHTPSGRGCISSSCILENLHPVPQVAHEGITHLLIEGCREEFDHVCQSDEEGWSQVAEVSKRHEKRSKGSMY